MSNLIQFRQPGSTAVETSAAVGASFVADPGVHSHAVQFYDSEAFLFDTVARFLDAGLRTGDRLVVIATAAHREGFLQRLRGPNEHRGQAVEQAIAERQLVLLDAKETLSKFMIGDMPDADLFHDTISRVLHDLPHRHERARIRAYGEMVDLLWREGNSRAAIRLEELWNDAGNAHSFALLCAYTMGNFYKEGDTARFLEVCRTHSHVIPTETFTELDDPHARLREISLLQQRARALESEIAHRKELENALRDALRERGRAEEELRACVKREQDAREQAEASDAYKEMFLGILGHDLRNPLNTILTTARLMKLRGELAPESEKRIDRMVTSGERMERMIAQLLDVTRARLAGGIPVIQDRQHDLCSIAKRICDELRTAHPGRQIDLRTDRACLALVDPDRFEQVISNLVGNALSHGDPQQPITVQVRSGKRTATLSVHNLGPPIAPAVIPALFDPFTRSERPRKGASGLGLGLYIVERIVKAHGGTITVESTVEAGTRFEVNLPADMHV